VIVTFYILSVTYAHHHQGGVITHEYKSLIKGFAATAPTKVVNSVKALGEKYQAIVEDDQVVSVAGSSS
jgi:hypothetical protein